MPHALAACLQRKEAHTSRHRPVEELQAVDRNRISFDTRKRGGLETVRSMPVHPVTAFRQGDSHQSSPARPCSTLSGGWQISCTVCRAQQPLAAIVKKAIGLVIHFHRHVGAAVEIGIGNTLVPDGKRPACLAVVDHLERHSGSTFDKGNARTQGDGTAIGRLHEAGE